MAEEPEDLTLRVLQELRDEMRSRFSAVDEKLVDLTQRVDGNTLIFNLIAGVFHDHEARIDKVESS